eukprot:CAMPEP_0194224056 /NCGR_PEP_ID=MMETSP0156-20130528/36560_1 /TAXON_ID=33649 /ORGANISM="Thalassionema nitzschioides, Strain L26-B" /LENGTH=214 /DNA_ID=CAMNT_0038955443 /DNA_START=20 /DNA_END=661 /DNA_ORIENTATION=+
MLNISLSLIVIAIIFVAILGLSPSGCHYDRRHFLATASSSGLFIFPDPSLARTPGSKDLSASIEQIQNAVSDLKQLEKDWSMYAIIDAEGRAGSTDGARRILGGIAPQAGSEAIDAAKKTPLYRIDIAFVTVRKAVLEDNNSSGWTTTFDLERYEELADRIIYETQKADGNFYGVLFAAKGTKMINDIFLETKSLVKQGIVDLEEMVLLLKDAG